MYGGHNGSVNSARFLPDSGNAVCTAGGDGEVHIWEFSAPETPASPVEASFAQGREPGSPGPHGVGVSQAHPSALLKLQGHSAPVHAADWLAGGGKIVSGKPQVLHARAAVPGGWKVCNRPRGCHLIAVPLRTTPGNRAGSADRTVKLWDVASGVMLADLRGHDHEVSNVCTHPTELLFATASRDRTFRLWDFRQQGIHEVNIFQGHESAVTSAVFADGNRVISCSEDRSIKVRPEPQVDSTIQLPCCTF